MRSFSPAVRHVFSHESFDGLSLDPTSPQLVNPKDLGKDFNLYKYQGYVRSLNKFFPELFPKIESHGSDIVQAQNCRKLLSGLKCVEVNCRDVVH
jgi:hypothetical protein